VTRFDDHFLELGAVSAHRVRQLRIEIQLGTTTLDKEACAGRVNITGSKEKVDELLGLLVKFNPVFTISLHQHPFLPDSSGGGDWNRIAMTDNREEFSLIRGKRTPISA